MDIHNEGNWPVDIRAEASAERGKSAGRRGAVRQDAPVLDLDEAGVILECSESCAQLFGGEASELRGQHVSSLYPQLSGVKMFLDGRFNPMLQFLCHCGHLFQASTRRGGVFKSELSFVSSENEGRRSVRLAVRPVGSQPVPGAKGNVPAI